METITSVPTPPGSRGHFAGAPRAAHNQRWQPAQLQTCHGRSPSRQRAPAPHRLSRGDSHHRGLVAAPPRAPSTTVRGLCPREGTSNPRDVPASRTASDEVTAPRAQAPASLLCSASAGAVPTLVHETEPTPSTGSWRALRKAAATEPLGCSAQNKGHSQEAEDKLTPAPPIVSPRTVQNREGNTDLPGARHPHNTRMGPGPHAERCSWAGPTVPPRGRAPETERWGGGLPPERAWGA